MIGTVPAAWQREIDAGTPFGLRAAAAIANAKQSQARPVVTIPDVSTIGTQILSALEARIGSRINCGTCRGYILGLNRQASHNHEAIVDELYRIGLPIANIVKGAEKSRAWIAEAISGVIPGVPFCKPLVNPTRSLIFHLYPKTGAEWNWHWHIEQIRKYAAVFNGRICIGVAVGKETATMEAVQELFTGIPVANWFKAENNKLAETNTHTEMLEAVQTDDENAIVFRYHTKGVTHSQNSPEQIWAEIMWAANMHLPSVEDALASHLTCGVMRSQTKLVNKMPGRFFYAGSAYWMRCREVFRRDWKYKDGSRWWVEYVPGHLFNLEESACLFHDLVPSSVLRQAYFDEHVLPEWAAWKAERGIE